MNVRFEKRAPPACLGYTGDDILPCEQHINHYKDPYLTTSILWKVRPGFFVAGMTVPKTNSNFKPLKRVIEPNKKTT